MIAATNRPDMIDPAMVRPGRLDKLLYVDLPSPVERVEILRTVMRKVPLGADGALSRETVLTEMEKMIEDRADGYSGADITSVVREAGVIALRRTLGTLEMMDGNATDTPSVSVTSADLAGALDKLSPSVSHAQRRKYEALRSKLSGLPVRLSKEEKRVDSPVDVV